MRPESIREVHARGGLPFVVGGTGFYYRALTRGLFPGPGRDAALRQRLTRCRRAAGRRVPASHAPARRSRVGRRIQPRDLKRIVRALEVFFLTGRPLTAHFAETTSPHRRTWTCWRSRCACRPRRSRRASRRRVDEQFERGLLDEIRGLLRSGVPESARPFGGLVYRQALEHLHGVRDEAATRALIAQENRRYARRQLIWFRKEPNLQWFDGPGESPATIAAVGELLNRRLEEIRSLMPPTAETRAVDPNIQDVFLNHVRREKLTVTVRMMDGSELEGRIKNFDRFAVVLDHAGADHMIFKHAIAAIRTPKPVANYFAAQ